MNIIINLEEVTYCCLFDKRYKYFRGKNLLRNNSYSDIICKYCIKKCKVHFKHTNEKPKYVAKLKVEYFKICSRKWLQTYYKSFETFARHQFPTNDVGKNSLQLLPKRKRNQGMGQKN